MILRAGATTLDLSERVLVMGVLNATPDSFSDARGADSLEDRLRRGEQLLKDGADLIDVGGESNVTNRPPVTVSEELERVAQLIERLSDELGALISVDTYKPPVAAAALAAGARIVNDISGLADPELATVCAQSGAGLVLMHTPVAPKRQRHDVPYGEDPAAAVSARLGELIGVASAAGLAPEQLVLDPGPDFGKTPAQTVAVLRGLPELAVYGRPVLLAVSRKDFVGALTLRAPRDRLAGTLAAIAHGLSAGARILRVHDVAATRDFLTVRSALAGQVDVPASLRVPEELRRHPPAPPGDRKR